MGGKPRQPNPAEKAQLAHVLRRETFLNIDAEKEVDAATIAVFDGYSSDSPGYQGRVMVVIWTAGPQLYEAFIWRNGRLDHVDQDRSLRRAPWFEGRQAG